MENSDYSFPYPVLGINDDIDGVFESEIKVSSDEKKVIFEIKQLVIENDYFKDLYHEGFIVPKLIIYCPSNLSTKVYKIWENCTISVPENDLINSITVSTILVANKEIKKYSNNTFHDDYKDTSFIIDKGNIVGVSGENTIMISKSDEKLSLGSIFTFLPMKEEGQPITFKFDQDQITIMAPTYKNILLFKYIGEHFMWTAMNIYVIPALTRALFLSENDKSSYKNLRWFQVLETIFPSSEREKDNHFENAQELLLRADINGRLPSVNNFLELRNE
ncbi:MAG: hypothetical protein BalsKO_28490 [Balneolaceae bacterium]